MRKQFDIKYRPQIESGEYKVETRSGKQVRVICWNKKSNTNKRAIVVLCDDGDSEHIEYYTEKGTVYDRTPAGGDLFIVTPEEELTEFEIALENFVMNADASEQTFHEDVKQHAAELLELAEKEIAKGHEHDVYIPEDTYYEQLKKQWEDGYDKGKAEALKEIEQDPESSYAFKRGVEYGKEEALKDLPRWEDNWDNFRPYKDISGLQYIVLNGKAMNVSGLSKLPGFNENEK